VLIPAASVDEKAASFLFVTPSAMASVVDSAAPKRQSAIAIAGCDVLLYNDEHFKKVRDAFDVESNSIFPSGGESTGKEEFSFDWLKPSGGKGGDLMGFTKVFSSDRKSSRFGSFIIKEMKGDDHKSMLDFCSEYCAHLAKGNSFISAFYYHFYHEERQQNFIVMNNCMPGGGFLDMYDLKGGTADDKTQRMNGVKVVEIHKRCWSPMNCGIGVTKERRDYMAGKRRAKRIVFNVTSENRDIIVQRIKNDTEFLKQCNWMDYSLLVGMKRDPGTFCAGVRPDQPFTGKTKDHDAEAYYIGIIDFLQGWNIKKAIAHYLKMCAPKPLSTVNPEVYGDRFYRHFREHFKGNAEALLAEKENGNAGVADPKLVAADVQ
jgi:hypothetical protein